MKKKNLKTVMIAISATILGAAMIQGCGKGGGGTAPNAAQSCGVNLYGQSTCVNNAVNGVVNGALSQACQAGGIYSANLALGGGAQVANASPQTSPDGTSVCQVELTQTVQGESSRVFLGPNAMGYQGGFSGITLAPYDQAIITASGSYSSGVFSSFGGCGGNAISDTGDVYGYIAGVNQFPLGNSVINVPSSGGGPLLVGLNQKPGSSGCLAIQIQAEILRCVDSSGNTHTCPSSSVL